MANGKQAVHHDQIREWWYQYRWWSDWKVYIDYLTILEKIKYSNSKSNKEGSKGRVLEITKSLTKNHKSEEEKNNVFKLDKDERKL